MRPACCKYTPLSARQLNRRNLDSFGKESAFSYSNLPIKSQLSLQAGFSQLSHVKNEHSSWGQGTSNRCCWIFCHFPDALSWLIFKQLNNDLKHLLPSSHHQKSSPDCEWAAANIERRQQTQNKSLRFEIVWGRLITGEKLQRLISYRKQISAFYNCERNDAFPIRFLTFTLTYIWMDSEVVPHHRWQTPPQFGFSHKCFYSTGGKEKGACLRASGVEAPVAKDSF